MIYYFAKYVLKLYYFLFFRLKISGKENIPIDGGFVLSGNHSSYHDPVVLLASSSRVIYFIGKKELFKNKIVSWLFRKANVFPIDRGKPDMKAFRHGLNVLKNDNCLGLFVQGTRLSNIDAKDAKGGVGMFATKANVPIVPVRINSNFKIFSKIIITYGKPMDMSEYSGKRVTSETLEQIGKNVIDEINAL